MAVFLLLLALGIALLGPPFRRRPVVHCRRCARPAAPVALPVAQVAWGLYLALWCGLVVRRLGREFYFWCVDDLGES